MRSMSYKREVGSSQNFLLLITQFLQILLQNQFDA
jgi:hypothetical protein